MSPARFSRSRAGSDSISMISTASVATSLASSTTSSQKARKKTDKTKLKVDGKVKDAVYLWALANFKGQTAFNHQLLLDAVEKGIKFFKYFQEKGKEKQKIYSEALRLHCSHSRTHGAHPLEFFYVKHIHFVAETSLVEIQMNGGCIAVNDASRLIINPKWNPINNPISNPIWNPINNEKVCSIISFVPNC